MRTRVCPPLARKAIDGLGRPPSLPTVGLQPVDLRRHRLGDRRLPHARGPQHPVHHDRGPARPRQQVGQDAVGEHRVHLVRHTGQRVGDAAEQLHPDAGRGAALVRQRLGALRQVGLPEVPVRDVAVQPSRSGGGAAPRGSRPGGARHPPAAARRLPGQVVLGGPSPPVRMTASARSSATRIASAMTSTSSPDHDRTGQADARRRRAADRARRRCR